MTTNPTAAAAALPIGSALQAIRVPSAASRQFTILRAPAMPEFGFLIRADAEPRYGWEAWLTIRHAPEDHLSAAAEESGHSRRVRIASNVGELDAPLLTAFAPAIATTCRDADIAVLFVQHACRPTLVDVQARGGTQRSLRSRGGFPLSGSPSVVPRRAEWIRRASAVPNPAAETAGNRRVGLVIPGTRVVDLAEYPLALLARYGIEVIADALAWIDFDRSRGFPRPITADRIRFLECHTAHLERDLETARRFRR